jgi:hypothetical protein
MANFFNKKQDVLEIQLTKHGKVMYSQGDFNPEYYSFYDTDITYDGKYIGETEIQNDIVTRIKGAVSTKSLYKFQTFDNNERQSNHIYKRPLGNSQLTKSKAPAWKITPIRDSQPISEDIKYQGSGSNYTSNASGSTIWYDQMIPLLSFDVGYKYNQDAPVLAESQIVDIEEEERILLQVEEKNVLDKRLANFEIEVFIEDDVKATNFSGQWKQLQFINRELISEEGLINLLNESDEEIEGRFPPLTSNMVEYWLDLRVDDEIIDRSKPETPEIYRKDISPSGEVCD